MALAGLEPVGARGGCDPPRPRDDRGRDSEVHDPHGRRRQNEAFDDRAPRRLARDGYREGDQRPSRARLAAVAAKRADHHADAHADEHPLEHEQRRRAVDERPAVEADDGAYIGERAGDRPAHERALGVPGPEREHEPRCHGVADPEGLDVRGRRDVGGGEAVGAGEAGDHERPQHAEDVAACARMKGGCHRH